MVAMDTSMSSLHHGEVTIMARKRNKSDSYQYRMVEIAVDPHVLSDFSDEDGFAEQVRMSAYSEAVLELRKQLMKEVRRMIETVLTVRQREVINLRLEGHTQVEIADFLGIHQTTVHKTISGNIDYKNNAAKYGGAIKKLRKACLKDQRVLTILKRISEAKAEAMGEGDDEAENE